MSFFFFLFLAPTHSLPQSEPGDAFNQFWKIMEGMLDHLSQPVAFATVPLAFDDHPSRKESSLSDTDPDDNSASRYKKGRLNPLRSMPDDPGVVDPADEFDVDLLPEDGASQSFLVQLIF